MAEKTEEKERLLIEQCLGKDARAQEQLYKRYSPLMYAICMRYSDSPDTAKDLLQETFIRVFGNLNLFRFEGSFEGWLRRVTVNTCIQHYRKNSSIPVTTDVEEAIDLGEDESATGKLQVQELLNLLQKLPNGYRTVFNLYAIEGYNHREIAEQLNISENTSKTQLLKARRMLQAMIAGVNKSVGHGGE